MFSPEFELLRDCCRWSFAGGEADYVATVDWTKALALARRHRVQALVWDCLSQTGAAVPGEAAGAVAADSAATIADNLTAARECALLSAAFGQANLPILFVKGLTLAALAYPKPFLKMGWDIDVLVDESRLEAAAAVLGQIGWQLHLPGGRTAALGAWHRRHKESVWAKAESGAFLELHTRLADNRRLIPSIGMQSEHQFVEVAPGITLPTLNDDELFAYLCVHGASSNWFRLKWITDVAALLHRAGRAETQRLWARSQELGAGRAAAQALLVADALYGSLAGTDLAQHLAEDRTARLLAQSALRELANPREPLQRPLGTAAIHLTQFALLSQMAFKRSEFARQLGAFFR